jgi:hypothetical protein
MDSGVLRHHPERFARIAALGEITRDHASSPGVGMDVGILKTRSQKTPFEVGDLGVGTHQLRHLAPTPDRHDSPTGDCYRLRPGSSGIGSEDSPRVEDALGAQLGHHS